LINRIRTYNSEFQIEAIKKIAEDNGNISTTAKQYKTYGSSLRNLATF